MLENHGLYIVATPIGNLQDITLRAIEVLKQVDVIAVEDTRHSSKLLNYFDIRTPIVSYHAHNEKTSCDLLLSYLTEGKNVALISDAGTPLISDPGFHVVREVRRAGYKVIPIPGVSALIAALSASGLPTNRFIFEGFLPAKSQARKEKLKKSLHELATIIFYESPHRIIDSLEDMASILGGERYVVLARELTKSYESIYGAQLHQLIPWIKEDSNRQRGEFVVLIHPAEITKEHEITDAINTLHILLSELPLKQAVNLAVKITGANKNTLYDHALALNKSKQHVKK